MEALVAAALSLLMDVMDRDRAWVGAWRVVVVVVLLTAWLGTLWWAFEGGG